MKSKFDGARLCVALMLLLYGVAAPALARAPRDFLTAKEEERVKEAQILDKRIEVFIKAAERRLLALTDAAGASKQLEKEMEKWGELPKGTRTELMMDIANILDAAITNIDDVALRDEKNRLIPKAMRKLADAAARFQTQLAGMRARAEGTERSALEHVMENVQEILAAAGKLPPPETKS
jgi:uncharacterized membrane-anchored protein YjiN (DUF445 family)